MAKSTPSTALTHRPPRPNSPCRAGKCFASPWTSRTGDDIAFQQPAAGDGPVAEADVLRLVGHAAGHRLGTARMEGAAARQVGGVGGLARNRIQRLLAAELRHRPQQGTRVRMLGVVEELA